MSEQKPRNSYKVTRDSTLDHWTAGAGSAEAVHRSSSGRPIPTVSVCPARGCMAEMRGTSRTTRVATASARPAAFVAAQWYSPRSGPSMRFILEYEEGRNI